MKGRVLIIDGDHQHTASLGEELKSRGYEVRTEGSQVVETLDAFSEEELQNLRRILGLEDEPVSGSLFFAHFHEEHEPDMRAWLEKVKKE